MANDKGGSPTPSDPLAWIPEFLAYIAANPDRPASLYSEVLDELVRRGLVELVPHLTPKGRKTLEARP